MLLQIHQSLHYKLETLTPITIFITSLYAIELEEGMFNEMYKVFIDMNVPKNCVRFEVDERSGVVRTRGTDLFQLDMEYVLYVKAEDQNGKVDDRRFQSTPEERLSIVGGKRAPQFYMPSYEAEIPENQKKDSE